MPGRRGSRAVRYLGALAASIGVLGAVVFDWDFGGTTALLPFAIGVIVAILAIGLTITRTLLR
ncbi:MAG: hypothetical protein ABEJ55_06285 [Halanaeroarchaeum sp.]